MDEGWPTRALYALLAFVGTAFVFSDGPERGQTVVVYLVCVCVKREPRRVG